jgi:hypothetical protein
MPVLRNMCNDIVHTADVTIAMATTPPPYAPPLPTTAAELLASLGLTALQPVLDKEWLDLDALLLCDDADLEKAGLPLGARRKIGHAVIPIRQARHAQLPRGVSTASVTFAPLPRPAAAAVLNQPVGLASGAAADADDVPEWIPQAVELVDLGARHLAGVEGDHGDSDGALRVCPALLTRQRRSNGQVLVELVGEPRGRTGVWLDTSSPYLRPVGWARLHGLSLTVPALASFASWNSYLGQAGCQRRSALAFSLEQAAPPGYVSGDADAAADAPPAHPLRVGMRLEALDLLPAASLICVATIAAVRGPQVLIHFDGWTDRYDYWTMHDGSTLFPCGYCRVQGMSLQAPKGRSNSDFDWAAYLQEVHAPAAPVAAFTHLPQGVMFPSHDPVAGASSVI